ncbi:aminotransferase class I/II-fold pyridoxal phosphate-dependent enzyme, partial [Candidatus Bathyarchaeota archaeon]
MNFDYADRVKKLPPYLFAEIEKITHEKKLLGIDIISLSIGDPDLPPPEILLNSIKKEASDKKNHNYSLSQGEPFFREAVSAWCKKRFKIDLTSDEVICLMGSKEGLVNIARAFVNS